MLTVSNTSPISNLTIIGQLDLLREQFGKLWIPLAVFAESDRIAHEQARHVILQAIENGWLIVHPAADIHVVNLLLSDLHPGEAEAIALALEMKADLLLIDEREGRRIARESGLTVRGVLGVLLRAKKTGRIATMKTSIDTLKNQAGFFIAAELEKTSLPKQANNRLPPELLNHPNQQQAADHRHGQQPKPIPQAPI
jgi:predicted nucleic acid-binding protein